jgi:hypothetical protein
VSDIFVDALDQDYIFAKMRNPLRTHYEEFATSADLDGLARTVDAKSHWMERSFWVGSLAGMLRIFREFNFVTYIILYVLCAGNAKTAGKKTSKIFFGEKLIFTVTVHEQKKLQPFKESSTAPQDVKPSFFHFRTP